MNNFYASVECLYRPEIRDFPVAVAGDPLNRHGIILAKNMLAKKLGVKTGEAIWQAKLKAPNLVTVPPDFRKYLKFSRLARQILYDYTDQIEPFGIDENWIDVTGSTILCGDGAAIANSIRQRIKEELGLTVSIGVSFNKIFAKLGSDMKKPDAVTVIPYDKFKNIIWKLPVSELLYVGKSTHRKLTSRGVLTIGDLANYPVDSLVAMLGKWGEVLSLFANGKDTAPVRKLNEASAVKSIGNGTTCPRDLTCNQDVALVFTVLSESVAARLRDYGLKCTGVQVYLRDNELHSLTRQKKLARPTYLSTDILNAGMELLVQNYTWPKPLRSIGIRAIDLVTENSFMELSLFDDNDKLIQQENLAHTIDALRSRFGYDIVLKASCLLDTKLTGFNPKEDHTIHPVSYFR
jgi:DNA polymerase-4